MTEPHSKSEMRRLAIMNKAYKCEECRDTGYVGDFGPGIRGNDEYIPCDCRAVSGPTATQLIREEAAEKERAEILEMVISEKKKTFDVQGQGGHDKYLALVTVEDLIRARGKDITVADYGDKEDPEGL